MCKRNFRRLLWKIPGDNSTQCCCRGCPGVGRWETKIIKKSSCWCLLILEFGSNHEVVTRMCVCCLHPGSPPSPVPPLPERTPESFELATDEGDVTCHHPKPLKPVSTHWSMFNSFNCLLSSCRADGHVGRGGEQNPSGVVSATRRFLRQQETFFEK